MWIFLAFSIFKVNFKSTQHSGLWDTLVMMLFAKDLIKMKMHWQNQLKSLSLVCFVVLFWIRNKKIWCHTCPVPLQVLLFKFTLCIIDLFIQRISDNIRSVQIKIHQKSELHGGGALWSSAQHHTLCGVQIITSYDELHSNHCEY